MSRVYNFSAGPAVLPEEVLKEAAAEMLDYNGTGMSVMEMSHRSKAFAEIITAAEQDLRDLMQIPDNYKVLFLQGGAYQQFAMIPMNLIDVYKRQVQAAVFENSYSTTEVSYAPLVEKQITGDDRPVESFFQFELTASEDNPEGAVLQNQTEVNASGPIYTEVEGAGHAGFASIRFIKAGEYSFAIREVNDGAGGYTYDEGIWNLNITVEDVDSILTVTDVVYTRDDGTENSEMAVFTNTYDSSPVTYAPEIVKKVEGEVPEDTDQKFEFAMEPADNYGDSITMPENTGTAVNGAGRTEFDGIIFRKAGSYEFRLTEVRGNIEGFTYDDSVWILTVDVADEDGQLVVRNAEYQKSGTTQKNTGAAEFVNIYSTTPSEDISTVQTGDNTNGTMPIVLMFGSAAAAGWAVRRRRRKNV